MSTQRQFLLGIFFLTALSILGFYTLFLTDFTLFKEPIVMDVVFPDAHGLREGDPVTVAGMRIGRVKRLEFDIDAPEDERIRVTLHLNEPVELVFGARITIEESSMLGGRNVDIYPGESAGPPLHLQPGEPLKGQVAKNPLSAIGDVGELFTANREEFGRIVANLAAITEDIRSGRGTIGKAIYSEELAESFTAGVASFQAAAENVAAITAEIQAGHGVVGGLLRDETMLQDARSALAELRATSEGLRRLIDDVQAGHGLAGRLFTDEGLGEDVASAADSLAGLLAKLERGEGPAGMLLNDPQLAADLREFFTNARTASADIRTLTAMVRNGEGTIGKLFVDEELYQELAKAAGLVTRSLEDYREAAPITAFTGVLFSAF